MLGFVGNAQFDLKKTSAILAKDKDFVSYNTNIGRIPNGINTKEITRINKNAIITSQDNEDLAVAFGFRNSKEAQSFESENLRLQKQLINKYSLNSLKLTELEELVTTAINLMPEYSYITTVECKKRRSSCMVGAMAVYGIEYAGCIGLGVTIARGSFWCAGCLGVGAGALCITAVTTHLVSMSDTCDFNYEDCVQNN